MSHKLESPAGPAADVSDVADVLDLLRDALREARWSLVRNASRVGDDARDMAFDAATAAEAEALRAVAESDGLTRSARRWFELVGEWQERRRDAFAGTPTLRSALGDLQESAWRVPPRVYRAVVGGAAASSGLGAGDAAAAAWEAISWLDTGLVAGHTLLGAACHDLTLVEIVGTAGDLRLALEARFPASVH